MRSLCWIAVRRVAFLGLLATTLLPSFSSAPPPVRAAQEEISGGPGKEPAKPAKPAEVEIHDNFYKPDTVTIPVGGTVHWVNHGQHTHTVTGDSRQWGSQEIDPKGNFSHTFKEPGNYTYHCAIHMTSMHGKIVVKK